MIKLFRYLDKRDWSYIGASLIFVIFQVWLDLKMPDYMVAITRLVQTEGSQLSDILREGGFMLLCSLGSLSAAFIVGYFAARLSASFSQKLRSAVFEKVESFSLSEINQFSTPSLITRSTNDINQVQMVIAMGLQVMIKAPILAVWGILKISGKAWQWSTATGIVILALIIIIAVIMTLAMPKFKIIQTLTDNLNRVTREQVTGIRVVKAYNAEDYQEARFDEANGALTKTYLFVTRIMAFMSPIMGATTNALNLSIYWIGAVLISNAAVPDRMPLFSDMVVFSSYAMQIVMAFIMMTMIFVIIPRAEVSAKRINEVLDTEGTILDGPINDWVTDIQGEIEFKNVSFKYPDAEKNIISNVTFKANKGDVIAFIGSTGSGKSTLINLIPRFYDATEGEVLVDGINVKEYTQEALHNKLGYIPQKAVMFTGTVKSNIAYGDNGQGEKSEEQIKRAIRIAQGQDFVEKLDGGYDAPIAQGGTNVSGGQKQRLAIARAIAREPEFLIFDDSFSALDYKTDQVLRKTLNEETKDITTLIVAQRIGTIQDADKIIVLEDGKVVGMDRHEELMKTCDVYQEIAYSQLTEEELA